MGNDDKKNNQHYQPDPIQNDNKCTTIFIPNQDEENRKHYQTNTSNSISAQNTGYISIHMPDALTFYHNCQLCQK